MSKHVRIVGRFDSFTGIGKHGWSFIEALSATENNLNIEAVITKKDIAKKDIRALRKKNIKVTFSDDVKGESDIAIFCDVMTQADPFLHQLGNINALFFAWDSTRIPSKFVKFILEDFDLVIVPTQFVKKAVLNSGIDKDIVVLPLVCQAPKKIPVVQKDRFTFGFIGSYEERKNVELLIESFLKALGNVADLRIHMTYSHKPCDNLKELLEKHKNTNIIISTGKLEEEKLFDIFNEIDCFISLSKGEGYSMLPREYMYLEKPVILSNSSGHQSIPKMDGVWFVDADIPYPAIYAQIDNKQHGLFYGPYIEDVIFVLKNVWQELQQKTRYPALSTYANTLSAKNLSEYYQGVVAPTRIIKSDFTSYLSSRYCLTVKSDSLIQKYGNDLLCNFDVNKQVVVANDGGFFSVFNRYISILVHALEENAQSIVIPDWRISSIIESIGHSHFSSFCYGTVNDGNIFLKIFAPPFDIPVEKYNSDKYLRDNAILRTDYNEIKEPNLTYIHAYKLYKQNGFQNWREKYHKYFSKYIRLRKDLEQKIESYKRKYFDGYYVIAAHIRHPSHSMEQPGGRMPTVEVFKEHIEQQLQKVSLKQSQSIKIFIATDQDSVIEYFSKIYPDNLITTHAARTTEVHDAKFCNLRKVDKQKEGYQIQHITAADKNKWSVTMADEVIIDTWLLAKSNVFIHITSNIATAVSFINPKVSMIYCS